MTGKQVTLQLGHGSMSGIVQDIDDQGCLLLASDGKILHIIAVKWPRSTLLDRL